MPSSIVHSTCIKITLPEYVKPISPKQAHNLIEGLIDTVFFDMADEIIGVGIHDYADVTMLFITVKSFKTGNLIQKAWDRAEKQHDLLKQLAEIVSSDDETSSDDEPINLPF